MGKQWIYAAGQESLRGRQGRPAAQDAGGDTLLGVCCILVHGPQSLALVESGSKQTQGGGELGPREGQGLGGVEEVS